ncbi:MAG: hypothetical protein ACR2F8_04610, partial [Caulobacteraceae bacterium]
MTVRGLREEGIRAVADGADWPAAGGRMGALIRAFDWSSTALGSKARWPRSLRTNVDTIVRSPVAIVMLWGA